MNHLKTYAQERAKLAALVEQEKSVSTKLRGFAQEQQAAQARLKEATERADAIRGKAMRGSASDEELVDADAESGMLFAKAALDELYNDERICLGELRKLHTELTAARVAVPKALEKLCGDMAGQRGESLKSDRKLRAQLVDIFAAHCGATDGSLGAVVGGRVDWGMLLEELFPQPTDAEFEAAYTRFQSQLR